MGELTEYTLIFAAGVVFWAADWNFAKQVRQAFRNEFRKWTDEINDRSILAWGSTENAVATLDRRLQTVPWLGTFEKMQVIAPLMGVLYGSLRLVVMTRGQSNLGSSIDYSNLALGVFLGALLGVVHAIIAGRVNEEAAAIATDAESLLSQGGTPAFALRAVEAELGTAAGSLARINAAAPIIVDRSAELGQELSVATTTTRDLIQALESTRQGLEIVAASIRASHLEVAESLKKGTTDLQLEMAKWNSQLEQACRKFDQALSRTSEGAESVVSDMSKQVVRMGEASARVDQRIRETVDSLGEASARVDQRVRETVDGLAKSVSMTSIGTGNLVAASERLVAKVEDACLQTEGRVGNLCDSVTTSMTNALHTFDAMDDRVIHKLEELRVVLTKDKPVGPAPLPLEHVAGIRSDLKALVAVAQEFAQRPSRWRWITRPLEHLGIRFRSGGAK